jgi:hypothetical protein
MLIKSIGALCVIVYFRLGRNQPPAIMLEYEIVSFKSNVFWFGIVDVGFQEQHTVAMLQRNQIRLPCLEDS